MSASAAVNRRIVLARRPQGVPQLADFRLERVAPPAVGPGQLLLRTRYLSLDPYMRGRMNAGRSYAARVEVDAVMVGQTVSVVESSAVPAFKVGELVLAPAGWQDYIVSDGRDLVRIDPALASPSHALGVLGMPGLTAYVGLLDIGQPRTGDTVVVGAVSGAVGSLVGQIAKLKGCRVVGIAGGAAKCDYALTTLGLDACLDHAQAGLPERLAQACPKGIDVYFESVGGAVLEAVLPLLNVGARVPVCGLISWYNLEKLPPGPDRTPQLLMTVLRQRIRMQGFIIFDHYDRTDAFRRDMSEWLGAGQVTYREELTDGLENAPRAFLGLLRGENFGKLVVRVSGE
jgi:hypothetical protein